MEIFICLFAAIIWALCDAAGHDDEQNGRK